MAGGKLDEVYCKGMQHHPFGYPVFKPRHLSPELFHVGACGYFDDDSNWTRIADVSSVVDDQGTAFQPMNETFLQHDQDEILNWHPKYSKSMSKDWVDIKGGVDVMIPPGIPLGVKAFSTYKSETDSGAILIAGPQVLHQRFKYKAVFSEWVKTNYWNLALRYPDLRNFPLWIVTGTYSAPQCSLNAWCNESDEFAVGFEVNGAEIANVGLQGGWYLGSGCGGWNSFGGIDKPEQYVVFIEGLSFTFSLLRWITGILNPLVKCDRASGSAGSVMDPSMATEHPEDVEEREKKVTEVTSIHLPGMDQSGNKRIGDFRLSWNMW